MKGGSLGTILPILAGAAALTGFGAPLAAGLLGAGEAGAAAGAGAAGLGADLGAGAAGLGADLGAGAAGLGAATDIGSSFLIPGTETALAGGLSGTAGALADVLPAAVGGILPAAGGLSFGDALPAASSLVGAATPATPLAATDAASAAFPVIGPAFDASASVPMAGAANAPAATTGGAAFGAGDVGAAGGGAGGAGDVGGGSDGGFGDWFKNPRNLLALAPLALGLGRNMFGGNTVPGSEAVTQAAQTAATNQGVLTGQGAQNISYVNTGALPAGAQTAIDQAENAAKAQVRSSFANMGIPAGSSMESQQLAAVDQNTAAQKFEIQNKLLQSGISEFNTAGAFGNQLNQLDLAMMYAKIQQEQELEQALAQFAGAMAGPITSTA